jgi:peptidoglycan/xylan/chitin deacetylase (PgdA/CDA1 family)
MFYVTTASWLLKRIYPSALWRMPTREKKVYLTFDDGPHPTATPYVLEQLRAFNAKATFFCLGKNVAQYPELYKRILMAGHATGNHTYNHLNGWKTPDKQYFEDILSARKLIDSNLFRPPYGRITRWQLSQLEERPALQMRAVMWTILSGDFDTSISSERCLENVIRPLMTGAIIVFHDSEKALPHVTATLPKVLSYLEGNGYMMEKITI